jgi:hypothetical protein
MRLSKRFTTIYGFFLLVLGMVVVGFLYLRQDLDASLTPPPAIHTASTSTQILSSLSSPSSSSLPSTSPSTTPSSSPSSSDSSSLSAYGGSDSSVLKGYNLGKKPAGSHNPNTADSASHLSVAYEAVQRGGGDAPLHQRARIVNTDARPLGPFGSLKSMRQSHALARVLFAVRLPHPFHFQGDIKGRVVVCVNWRATVVSVNIFDFYQQNGWFFMSGFNEKIAEADH